MKNLNDTVSLFKKTVVEFEKNELEESVNDRLHVLIYEVNSAFNELFNKLSEKNINKIKHKKIISSDEKKNYSDYREKIERLLSHKIFGIPGWNDQDFCLRHQEV